MIYILADLANYKAELLHQHGVVENKVSETEQPSYKSKTAGKKKTIIKIAICGLYAFCIIQNANDIHKTVAHPSPKPNVDAFDIAFSFSMIVLSITMMLLTYLAMTIFRMFDHHIAVTQSVIEMLKGTLKLSSDLIDSQKTSIEVQGGKLGVVRSIAEQVVPQKKRKK